MHFPSTQIFDSSVQACWTPPSAATLPTSTDSLNTCIATYNWLTNHPPRTSFPSSLTSCWTTNSSISPNVSSSSRTTGWMATPRTCSTATIFCSTLASPNKCWTKLACIEPASRRSQTTVQALVAEGLPKLADVISELCATVAEQGKQLRQLSGTPPGNPGSGPGGRQRTEATGWDDAKHTTPPEDSVETAMLEGMPIFYCRACGWNTKHVTAQHHKPTGKNKGKQQQKNNKRNGPGSSPGQSMDKKQVKKLCMHVTFLDNFHPSDRFLWTSKRIVSAFEHKSSKPSKIKRPCSTVGAIQVACLRQ